MKQFIYISEFNAQNESTKKQAMLFATDVKYAFSEGYEFIQDSTGMTFSILADNKLVEVDVTEEELQAAAAIEQDEVVEDLPSEEYCTECHNIMLIDGIINNTLSQTDPITPQQAETMIKLAHLKEMLLK